MVLSTLHCFILLTSSLRSTLSNALLKFKYTIATAFPWFTNLVTLSKKTVRFVWHALLSRNPCWLLIIKLFILGVQKSTTYAFQDFARYWCQVDWSIVSRIHFFYLFEDWNHISSFLVLWQLSMLHKLWKFSFSGSEITFASFFTKEEESTEFPKEKKAYGDDWWLISQRNRILNFKTTQPIKGGMRSPYCKNQKCDREAYTNNQVHELLSLSPLLCWDKWYNKESKNNINGLEASRQEGCEVHS